MTDDTPVFNKDPDETTQIRPVEWKFRLGTATITDSSWIVPAGLTKGSEVEDGTLRNVIVSGGTLGETYKCTNRIVTSAGETLEQSVNVYIREK